MNQQYPQQPQPGQWPRHPPGYQPPYGSNPPPAPAGRPSARTYKIAARRQKSTAVHGILTLCTVGVWSPVWFLACAENARIRKAQAQVAMYEAARR